MDLAGVAVCVAGAGVTGRSVATALVGMGAQVTVTDANAERLAELGDLGVRLVPGLDTPPDGTRLVVTSPGWRPTAPLLTAAASSGIERSEEHTSELQSRENLVCRLLLEKKKK